MIRALREFRSGRIIALCRAVLAVVFFLALWIDPGQPARQSTLGYALIGCYMGVSFLLLTVAMRGWWWDHRLAWPVLAVDVAAFLAAVYFTEGGNSDFTSPFLAFFTFLMLTTTLRWDWRVTAGAALLVTTLYLLIGLTLVWVGVEFDLYRFGRRVVYMVVLSLILIWFGVQRREQHIDRFGDAPDPGAGRLPPLEGVLAFALEQSGARSGAVAWSDSEEPAIELRTMGIGSSGRTIDQSALSEDRAYGDKVRLFSADRQRRLRASSRGRPVAISQRIAEPFADLLEMGDALAVPFAGGTGRGEVILNNIPGLCADHVDIGVLISRELEAALDRHATLTLSHESALARSREALARDLHDSVAQSLAGAALRLEGLRKSIHAGKDPEAEIVQLKEALRAEQTQVRAMIDRLRDSGPAAPPVDLGASLARLVNELAANWGVATQFVAAAPVTAPAALAYELGNITREAIANAVRHGRARSIAVNLRRDDAHVIYEITDDGSGFPAGTSPQAPRSIRERVTRQGGTLAVQSSPSKTCLTISLPVGDCS